MVFVSVMSVEAKDLGVYGEVFPIWENNLLEVIQTKLKKLSDSGQLEKHQKVILNKAKAQMNRPTPIVGIQKTTQARSFTYDPTITVPYDLKDHRERVFHKKGTRINPLDTHQLKHPLLFVDSDDETQVAWAVQEFKSAKAGYKPKIVLVKGAPFELAEKLPWQVYFDQAGRLVKKLGMTQVPAEVVQKGKVLEVKEVKP